MAIHALDLILLPGRYVICRLDQTAQLQSAPPSGFWSITRTADELSLVCEERWAPQGARVELGWRGLRVAGSMDFSIVGVIAGITAPLADANLSVFVLSTFDTDYLFVKEQDWTKAIATLRDGGHSIRESTE